MKYLNIALLSSLAGVLGLSACQSAAPQAQVPVAAEEELGPVDPNGWRLRVPEPAAPAPIAYPSAGRQRLASGLSLLTLERPASTLTLGVTCLAGSAYDPVGRAGTSAFVARMLTEGTKRLDSEALAISAERLGTTLDATSTEEAITVHLEVLPQSAEDALAILADVVLHPAFRAADVKRVRREWLDNLALQRENPSSLAQLVARRALLGPVAGESSLGTAAQIKRLTPSDLARYHETSMVPSRCAVLSSGALSAARLQTLVEQHFAEWKDAPARVQRRQPQWPETSRVLYVERADAVQTSILLATRAPSRAEPGQEARRLIDDLFGGLFTSRINTNLREDHAYTYGAFSRLNANPHFGIWSIQTEVKSEVTSPAIEQILLERKALVGDRKPSADEIARAKSDLIHDNAAHLEHTNSLFGDLQAEFSLGLPPDYFVTFQERVDQLGAVDVQAQLAAFTPGTSVLVLVGPAAALDGKATWLGVSAEKILPSWLDTNAPTPTSSR